MARASVARYLLYLLLEFPALGLVGLAVIYAFLILVLLVAFFLIGAGVVYKGIAAAASLVFGDGSSPSISSLLGFAGMVIGIIESFTHYLVSLPSQVEPSTRPLAGAIALSAVTLLAYLLNLGRLERTRPWHLYCIGLFSFALYLPWLPVLSNELSTDVVLYAWLATMIIVVAALRPRGVLGRKEDVEPRCYAASTAFIIAVALPLFWVITQQPDTAQQLGSLSWIISRYYVIYSMLAPAYTVAKDTWRARRIWPRRAPSRA